MEISMEDELAWNRRDGVGGGREATGHAITLLRAPRGPHAVCRPPPNHFLYYNLVNFSDVKHSYN